MSASRLEVEVKFFVRDLAALRIRLLAAGATIIRPRVFEKNVRYDNADNALADRLAILRLRQDAKVTMTYKGVPADIAALQSAVRVREELEVELSDFETAHLLLQRIGFAPRQVYEKHREALAFNGLEVVLDEMPYGNFIELEGDEATIRETADLLQLDWEQRIVASYLALLAQLNIVNGTTIHDLTFDNFADNKGAAAQLFNL